jgi:TolA-binding protein
MKKPPRKPPTLTDKLKKAEQRLKELEKRVKELEHKITKLDLDEITVINDQLHRPSL